MSLEHRLIERTLDAVAESVALMGVLGNRPVSLQGIGAYLERRVAAHLARMGLTQDQIAAFFEHRTNRTTRTWLSDEPGLGKGEMDQVISHIEAAGTAAEPDVVHAFVTAEGPAMTDDQARRRKRRALDILGFLADAGVVSSSGPAGRRVFTAVPVPPHHGLDATIWLYVHRHGPAMTEQVAHAMREPVETVTAALGRLQANGVVHRAGATWSAVYVMQPDKPQDWHASVIDHLEAVLATVSARLRDYLAPGLRSTPAAGTGFDTLSFSLNGRDVHELVSIVLAFRERLHSELRDGADGRRLRVYLGQSFDEDDA